MKLRDVVFWILFSGLVAYIVLKASGFIQSPPLVELSPFALVALLIIVIRGDIKKDINDSIQPLKELINNINNRLSKLEGITETILHLSKRKK